MRPPVTALAAVLASVLAAACTAAPPPPPVTPVTTAPVTPPAPPPSLFAPPAVSGVVARVETRGSGDSQAALRRALATRPGDPYDPARIQDDLRALWALRLFEDVSVEAEIGPSGVALTYVVAERPHVQHVSFSPLTAATPAELATEVASLVGAPADPALIDGAGSAIRDHLVALGHRLARVEAEKRPAGEGRIDVHFVIDEGPRVVVESWAFSGNDKTKEKELRAVMKSGTHNVAGGLYDEDLWERDALLITAYYFDHGMLSAHVGAAEVTPSADGTKLSVVMPIVEGPVFRLGKIEVADAAAKKAARPGAALRIKHGDIFNRTRVKEDLDRLKAWFAREQHRTVDISPATELDMGKGRVDLVLHVEDAKP